MELLSKLFGSADRVRMMRLFFLGKGAQFNIKEIALKCKIKPASAKRELGLLKDIGFVKSKNVYFDYRGRRKSEPVWFLNESFTFLNSLKQLLFNAEMYKKEDVLKRLKSAGRLKAVIIAGIFLNDESSRADLLIVGDLLRKGTIDRVIKTMEAELGRELVYGVFETEDFKYRLDVYDKFVRDVLDFPHEKILNKLPGVL